MPNYKLGEWRKYSVIQFLTEFYELNILKFWVEIPLPLTAVDIKEALQY